MNTYIFNDCEWTYPDTPQSGCCCISLDAPRGGHCGFQVLGGEVKPGCDAEVSLEFSPQADVTVAVYELVAVGVSENTAPTLMTTTDYTACRDYVTRQAPFLVYDALRPFDGTLKGGRLALYICIDAAAGAGNGLFSGTLIIKYNSCYAQSQISLCIHKAAVPPPGSFRLGMMNFFNYADLGSQHGIPVYSAAYWDLFRKYVRAQLDLHCTHIMLPTAAPIIKNGEISCFDFSNTERAAKIAVEEGAPCICGGHVAHWSEWTGNEYYLAWDSGIGVTTQEGYLQLRRYFEAWADIVARNGWQGITVQALADEPQMTNGGTYRILAAIFRKLMPGIPIIDAVETADLGGGIDIWAPKQDTYEKCRGAFDRLKEAGETMWYYTCAFPAGSAMNRSMDLPLAVSRSVLWIGAAYRLSGFLHWGFNYYTGSDIWHSACCPHKGALLPAGDAHIVYPGESGPWRSMRFEAHRGGAEDYELLVQALELDRRAADQIISRVCTSSRSYTSEGTVLLGARRELLSLLDKEL